MIGPSNTDPKSPVQLDIFYNTTHMSREEIMKRRASAGMQNKSILDFFRDNPEGYFTPFEVQEYTGQQRIPITSIRRALNTLTQAGLLVKTDKLRPGDYGMMNHTWKKV
jgi:hypothetical protein